MPNRDTDKAGEVIMPVAQQDALQHIEITALRQLGDAIAVQTRALERFTEAQTRAMERIGEKMDNVQARLIKLEEQRVHEQVAAVNGLLSAALSRIDVLEALRDQARGGAAVVAWFAKNAPWLITIILAVAAAVGFKTGVLK